MDDFVERTFNPGSWGERRSDGLKGLHRRSNAPLVWEEPWVGIFHHPPAIPSWFQDGAAADAILAGDRFQRSLPQLRGGVAMSEWHASWLRERLPVSITVLKHPTEFPDLRFEWSAFEANKAKELIQIGWFLRNYRAIYQVPVPGYISKIHLAQDQWFVHEAQRRTDLYSLQRHRPDIGEVEVRHWVSEARYDEMFTKNIVFMELIDASANNVVIEAIVRNTPLIVNRHPAVMEYLGPDYPLYFDDIAEVRTLLDLSTIRAAHEHLVDMDKSDLSIDYFRSGIDQVFLCLDQMTGVEDAST